MADKTIPALKILRGKVGINIATPTQQLHVNGEAFISTGSTSVRTLSGIFKADTIENSAGASNLKLQTESGGNKHIEITPNGTGNVGIGTNAPAAPLTVNGGAIIGGITRFTGGGTNELSVNLAVSECVGFGASNSAFTYFRRYSASIETFQIQPVHSGANNGIISMVPYGGQVHIGMGNGTAAKSLLTISGNSDNGDNACALRIIDEDDTGGSKLPAIMFYGGSTMQGRIRGGDGTFTIAVGSAPSTALTIDATSRKFTLGSYGSGTHTGTATYKLSVNSNGDIIETAIGAGAVDGSGTANYVTKWTDGDTIGNSSIFDNGSVGIATNDPKSRLDIGGSFSDAASDLNATNGLAIKQASTDSRYGIYLERAGERRGYYIGMGGPVDSLTFERNNLGTKADVMSLTRDGYVGIGTNNPSQKLHVIGAAFIDNTGTTGGLTVEASSNANITLQNAQNTAYSATLAAHWNYTTPMTLSGYGGTVLAQNTGVTKTLLYANNAEQIRITATGVGIGLGGSDPTTKLHVGGGTKIEGPLGGVLNSSITRIENFILDTKGEDAPVINHQLNNDLALLRVKGNTVTYSGLSSNPGDSETDRFFEANSYFGDVAASEISNASTGFTITLDSLPRNLTYTTRVGISFATPSWRCSYVKIEVYRAGAWNTIREETSNSSATVYQYYNTGSSAISKIRYTLKTPVTTSLRIVSLFAFNYNSTGATGYYLSQAGGSVYGSLNVGPTSSGTLLEVGNDGNTDYALIGPTKIGGGFGHGDYAGFSHRDRSASASYALLQHTGGTTYLNSNIRIYMGVNNVNYTAQVESDRFQVNNMLTVTGSVGIGGTPSAALDLFGANAASVAIRIVGGNKFQFLNASSNTNANIYNSGASGAAELAFQIAGVTKVTIDNSGNVGIGDNSPQVGLSLYGDGNISRIKISTTSNHQLNIGEWDGSTHRIEGDANRKLLITSYSSDGIHLGGSGSSHVVIKGGKVGINTTGPVAKLDVRGDLIVDATNNNYGGVRIHDDSSGDYNVYLDMGRNQGNTRFHIRNAGRTAGTTTWASGNDVAVFSAAKCWIPQANVGIGTVTPSNKLHVFSSIANNLRMERDASNDWQFLLTGGSLQIQDATNSATRLTIDSSGKLGISTTSPVEKLDVVGKQRITQTITSNNTYYMLAFGSNRSINDYGGLNKDYWRLNVVTPGSSTTGEGSGHGYGDLRFSSVTGSNTTYADRLTVRYNGNVGIGTNVPSAKLHIQSDGSHDEGAEIVLKHANNNTTDVVSTISFQNNAGQVAMIQAGTTGANNTGYISFFTDSTGTSGERMRIQGNGFVGIGTATAYSPLQVYSSEDQKILLSGSANPFIRWQNGGSNRAYIQWIESGSIFGFFNSVGDNFDFFTHDAGGAINLRLKGNDGDIWGSVYGDENGGSHTIGFLDGDGDWALQHIKDTSWDFRINNSSKMTINSSGTVAVGGTTLLTNEGIILNRSGGAGYLAFYDGSGGAKWNIQRNSGVSNCLRIHAYNNTSQVFKVTKNYNDTDGFNILLDSGSVGMGTNSPNKTLEVRYVSTSTNVTAEGLGGGSAGKGLLIYNNNQSNNNVYANLDFRARNADGRIAYQYQTADNVGDFHFITDNSNSPQSMMTIKNDGKIGIGTTNPATNLYVGSGTQATSNMPGISIGNGTGTYSFFSASDQTKQFIAGVDHTISYTKSGNLSNHDHAIITNNTNRIYIEAGGNIGIGTNNATNRLDIRSVQAAGDSNGSNLASITLETYNSNSPSHGSYVRCKNYVGGGGGPDWKIGGMEGYWTTNKVASIDFMTGDDWLSPGNKDEGEIAFTVYNNTGSGSTAIEAMRIHQTGNIGIGSTNPGSKLTVNGSFSASSKSFLIDHPTKENKKLEHGCLEGPEFGVYHRGTTQSNTITLPDYWSGLVREDTVTVQLTPRGGFQHLYVVSTSLSQIVIGAADGEAIDCFYTIYGERADIDSLVVEKDV